MSSSDSSDTESEKKTTKEPKKVEVCYGKPSGNPLADNKRYKATSQHIEGDMQTTTREKVGRKKYMNERTEKTYNGKNKVYHYYKEKGVAVNKPKDVKKAMKPTKADYASGAFGIWKGTSDNLAEMKVTGFDDSTTSACTGVAAAEATATTKTEDTNPFAPCASAGASAGKAGAACGASGTGMYAYAGAKASGAEASASAALVGGVGANAEAASAQASANVSPLGAHAGADAKVAGASAGLLHTPLQASVSVAKANAEAGVGWEYTGASAGASLAEARAGPFGVRAGVKFGAGIRNGIPEVDMGPVTVPCCVM